MEKGQVSVEFIIALMLLFFLFLFSLWVFSEKKGGLIYSKENHEARLLADKLAGTINAVYLAGSGTETSVLLEKRVDFNVSVSGNAVRVEWRDNFVDAALLTDNITVSSMSAGGFVNVKNVNGGIEIENI